VKKEGKRGDRSFSHDGLLNLDTFATEVAHSGPGKQQETFLISYDLSYAASKWLQPVRHARYFILLAGRFS
jgi:hypothetical protein